MSFLKVSVVALVLVCLNAEVTPQTKITPTVLVHGGAGRIRAEKYEAAKNGVKTAARIGHDTLLATGSVLDAVQEAVRSMELNPNFNAGYGAVLTWNGTVEMDAAIMNGAGLEGGCVSIAQDIQHPIVLARQIMEKTRHRYLAGEGAMKFAVQAGFEILSENALVTEGALKALDDYKNSLNPSGEKYTFGSPGTVGAVAIDEWGNVAAATSTGGITGKLPGRIGDSPILGGGTYADNESGAVSATGNGETIMRFAAASRILANIVHKGMTAQAATAAVLEEMTARFNETAGIISIDAAGNLGIYFTSPQMSWAYQRGDELHYGIEKDEDYKEIVGEPRISFL